MIYRQLPVIEKSQPIAPKYEIKSAAQHQGLRGRKHVYKIVPPPYTGLNKPYIQVRVTRIFRRRKKRDNPYRRAHDHSYYQITENLVVD